MSICAQDGVKTTCELSRLGKGTEDGVVATNGWSLLHVIRLRMGDFVEFVCRSQHRSSEPDGVSLHLVRDHLHVNRLCL